MSVEDAWAGAVDSSSNIASYVTNFRFVYGVTPYATWTVSLGISFLYLTTIYVLHKVMASRQKFEIRLFSLLHNFNMFAISVICTLGLAYGTIRALYYSNWDVEVIFCDSRNTLTKNGPLLFWQYIFWLSKLYELLDTVILCLRKSDIIFLHVYHHWITNILCFWTLYFEIVSSWSATTLNAAVHIPMYLYYWLSIAGYRDLWFKKYITQMQIVQFLLVISLHSGGFVWHYHYAGNCHSYDEWWKNAFGMAVILSYLLQFIGFYKKSYKAKDEETKTD